MPVTLAEHTTLRVGGPATEFVVARSEFEIIDAVRGADEVGLPVLILGGGSNLLIGDDGFDGRVVQIATHGVDVDAAECGDELGCMGALSVTVQAGESWDAFVERAVGEGWVGIEAMSGIPGLVGATPIQNVGAYGQEVSTTVASVRTWDRVERRFKTFAAADCRFGYRTSRFKDEPDRYVVLQVTFLLKQGTLSTPIAYTELARALETEVGQRRPLGDVREAVLRLRRAKGMVLDEADHDTWSAGSFFTNPILPASDVPEGAPSWPQPDGLVKTSAAWLIEHAGFNKGYGSGPAQLSTKHTLAVTNRGGADTEAVVRLAREIRNGVEQAHGVELVPEPVLINCVL